MYSRMDAVMGPTVKKAGLTDSGSHDVGELYKNLLFFDVRSWARLWASVTVHGHSTPLARDRAAHGPVRHVEIVERFRALRHRHDFLAGVGPVIEQVIGDNRALDASF